ncbi:MAG: 4-hydroxy-tetrahydrodipicolinate reductase [Capsulimonadales bacterium]|nr:4-hydroxy-tetrahydrodipicolinate reductase [Capsulimonadales bacterium]
MAEPMRVAVCGARGRMGSETVRAISDAPDLRLVAGIDQGDDLATILRETRPAAMVDFTVPDVVLENIRTALAQRVVPIVGTTGFSPDDLNEVRSLCETHGTGCLIAPNFAIGALLMMRFAAEAARYLPDVEILEMHHERKVDAPSGTAVKTAEMIATAREGGPVPAPEPVDAFEKFVGSRGGKAAGDIRIHSVRLPGFVASQEVIFGGAGQRLSIRHDSIDRASFMPGVLLALRRSASVTGLVYGLENLL